MALRLSPKVWVAVGASLAVSGGFAIFVSLPEGGQMLWIGVALIVSGSLCLRIGVSAGEPAAVEGARPAASSAKNVEPELRAAAPRGVVLNARGKLGLFVWLSTVAVFAGLALQHFARFPPPDQRKQLDSEGLHATASIHARETRSLENGEQMHFVGYSFLPADGELIRINRSVDAAVFPRFAERTEVEVVYWPDNPTLHYLPEHTSPVSTKMVLFIGLVLLLIGGIAEAQRRQHRRLVSTGMAVPGFVADVRRRGGVRSFRVNYDVDGRRHSISGRERNPELRSGQTATVLYDPALPSRGMIYRLALYRAR